MSVLNDNVIYEFNDLLNAKTKDEKEKIVMNFVETCSILLADKEPFLSSFLGKTSNHRYISYKVNAPAAVLITTDHKESYLNLYLNPDIIIELFKNYQDSFFDDFTALLIHEMLHLVYEHQAQEKELFNKDVDKKIHLLCNIAQDSKINSSTELKDNKFINETGITLKRIQSFIKKRISIDRLDEMNWMQIFTLLKSEEQKNPGLSEFLDKFLEDEETTIPSDTKLLQKNEEVSDSDDVKNTINSLIKKSIEDHNINDIDDLKSRGILSSDFEIANFKKQKIDDIIDLSEIYEGRIHRLLHNIEYTNKRHLRLSTHDFKFKLGKQNKKIKEVIAYIDTSGSVNHKEIQFFLSELSEITKKYHNISLTAIPFGTEVDHEHEMKIKNGQKEFNFNVEQNGTCVNSVFEDIIKQRYYPEDQMIIILTDGETEDILDKNLGNYQNDVIWIIDDKNALTDLNENEIKKKFPGKIYVLGNDKKFILKQDK